ncbi:RTA1 like protein [Gloeophyllum trabeum ATCC 11539]|uniref:RTA1 like protein n=1 Tax=Gloeophyllum trabeum (strain ATCC 11539 / FP-39264 / Madison 617) TaxID=670483 RepID=S7Q9P2_GLOTA|nr:RTA1 like protein [Gloeophyllum trabeum ATCC 11539]EPQ56237.1 RTA1 like protein [Gloeophyllum trabeum ATCC 11539]
MAIGYFVRFAETYGSLDDSLGIYIIMDLLILCAPATFLAFNYIVYGRTIVQCIGREHSIIRPERVARIFVISDISTFFLQASGGGLTAMNSLAKLGNDIVLVGLILQALSYVFFIFVAVRAHRSVVRSSPRSSVHKEAWWRVLWVLYFSSIFVLIRCIYRIVEFAQGYDGYLVTHEVYFYCLDALPLLIAISVYIPFWPSKYLSRASADYMIPLGSIASM